jgi:hypothetical protein
LPLIKGSWALAEFDYDAVDDVSAETLAAIVLA